MKQDELSSSSKRLTSQTKNKKIIMKQTNKQTIQPTNT